MAASNVCLHSKGHTSLKRHLASEIWANNLGENVHLALLFLWRAYIVVVGDIIDAVSILPIFGSISQYRISGMELYSFDLIPVSLG